MTKPLQSLGLEHLGILGIKDIQLLLVLCVGLQFVLGLSASLPLFLVVFRLEGRDVVDHSDGAWSVDSCRDSLLPNFQVVLLELVEVFELSFELTSDKKMFSLFMHSE